MNQIESWLVNLTGEQYLWVFELFLIVLIALSLGFVLNRMIDKLEVQAAKTKTVWDDALIEACRRPAIWLIWILGINFAASIAAQKMDSPLQALIDPINRLALIFLGTLFLTNFIKRAERNLIHPDYIAKPLDATTVRAVGKLLRASVIITGVLIAMQLFGYSISGLLAFGGIGGIAVGFAAKDLLANFFGGLMIYLDRPFSVGEWIRSPDKEIEGVVEDIGWRLTRIRTFDKRPLYIPNAVFANISVENPSRMSNRRIYETVGIRYEDINSMDAIVEQVTAMLMEHPEIDTTQTMIVNFDAFSASSVDFFVYTFTKTTNWIDFHKIKQDVLLRIAGIVEANSAEIAFPTSTLHIARGELMGQST
ncbi:mechanosensitive ion channel family protein [Porticoccaceae bacterium]|jgi:MscS family membrane protein|nr:mechanosensitive ion channel family protein [Porticoccaceae bacterium]MDB4076676.1 mechanosensitive ion channel family protein [Porticoccaceae bacterium]MDB9952534.1 mechanosensitive ion channel family protein [Porticoccaceae bacterium]MDC0002779.1 mechanosensitive ion channel family protein [Porticoccaceae bacterium]